MNELDVLQFVISERCDVLVQALEKVHSAEASLMDLVDFESEVDTEYQIDLLRQLSRKLGSIQKRLGLNDVEFLDQSTVFRPEQCVETLRVRGGSLDSTVYVLESRHGAYFLYTSLEGLIDSFLKGKDSKLRFECRAELESYLNYWQGYE
ncbi:hypothetical protein [Rubritalea halochordaticola]|uniref:hypothetical protein n=1 Tax=Rubritalea halochordaticola TaxID=714537 RepID=UPI0031FC6FDA